MSGNAGNSGTDLFEEFAAAGDVQVGESNLAAAEAARPVRQARRGPPKEAPTAPKADESQGSAADDGDDGGDGQGGDDGDDDDLDLGRLEGDDDGDSGDDGDDGDDDGQSENREGYMKRLKRERAEARRQARELAAENARLRNAQNSGGQDENSGLPNNQPVTTNVDKLGPAPDPTDSAKYPLGHLDAQYVEDKIAWTTELALAKQSDAALQRQQEQAVTSTQQREQQRLLGIVDTMAKKGSEIYDDFQTAVVDAGMKGGWKLQQATFEAAADPEIEHGARILYNLAKNPAEAERVASMTPVQQIKYVTRKNDEIADKIAQRRIPRADPPVLTRTRGANSRTSIRPDTDNLDDFEKLVRQDAKRNSR